MMKAANCSSQPSETRSTDDNFQQFEIENLRLVPGQRSFVAAFDVILTGARIIDCRLHVRKTQKSVSGPGRPAGWLPERWKTLVEFDNGLAAEILEVVSARLEVLERDEKNWSDVA